MRRWGLLFLGMLGAWPIAAQTHPVQKFEGRSSSSTAIFTVDDKWEVAWDTPAPLSITVLTADGTIVAGTTVLFHGSLYLPKGGTYYFQVNGVNNGPMAPWHLSVLQMNESSAPSPGFAGMTGFTPPSAQPPGSSSIASGPEMMPGGSSPAPALPASTPPPAPASTGPVVNLTEDQTRAIVMIEGDNSEGTGFLVKMPDGSPAVVTNLHVLAGNPHVRLLTNTGLQIAATGLKGASDRDLAVFSIQDNHYNYLDVESDVSAHAQAGDDVITPGNSQGGEVVLPTHGTILGIGPDRVEFSNPIYHGNSGGPVFDTKTGKVLGVVTEAMKVDTSNSLDKTSFASRNSAITSSMRYFGLRLDTVPKWETYDPVEFLNETAFLKQFHEQSRRLDSYLNSSEKTDNEASRQNDDNVPSSKLYLSDQKICRADDQFHNSIAGADASQRMDALRQWLFDLNGIADTNFAAIQNPGNFYTYEQQQAREELAYRKALKAELYSFGDDISRAQSLGRRN